MKARLNKSTVDKLQPRAERYDAIDDRIPGFIVRVNANGTKTAMLRYRRDGRNRAHKLGVLGEGYTVAQARRDAAEARATVDAGGDPARARDLRRALPTFGEVAERYMTEIAEPYRKASTVRSYRGLLRNHLAPALGSIKVAEIDRTDVERLHQQIGKSAPGAANRALALVSVIMTNAERWGYRDTRANPCHRTPKFPERKMERFLSAEERARLDAVLSEAEQAPIGNPRRLWPGTILAARLLLLTGARLGEIIGLRWSMVDLERSCLRLPDSKTGAKVIPLSPQAVSVLRAAAEGLRPADGLVCTGEDAKPLANFRRSWRSIRHRAELDDVRIHDARHSVASDMLANGMTLPEIGLVLGHKSTQTTARYAHFSDEVQRDIATRMGAAVERSTRKGAEAIERKRQAAGDERGTVADCEPSNVTPIASGKVIPLRRRS